MMKCCGIFLGIFAFVCIVQAQDEAIEAARVDPDFGEFKERF